MLDIRYNESTKRGTDDFPIAYYHECTERPSYYLPLHWHLEQEIIHVLSGSYPIFIDGTEYELHPGDICFIQNGVLHGDGSKKPCCEYESVVFDLNLVRNRGFAQDVFLAAVDKHLLMIEPFPNLNAKDSLYVADILPVFDYMRKKNKGYELEVCGSLMRFFSRIQRDHLYIETGRDVNSGRYARTHKRTEQLKKVFDLIEHTFNTQLTLEQLSSVAGMSSKYFCRVFKSMTNHSPMEYVNVYRIEQASYMIEKDETPLIDIAFNCGFNDFSYFIKMFKKYRGITPLQYRKSI